MATTMDIDGLSNVIPADFISVKCLPPMKKNKKLQTPFYMLDEARNEAKNYRDGNFFDQEC